MSFDLGYVSETTVGSTIALRATQRLPIAVTLGSINATADLIDSDNNIWASVDSIVITLEALDSNYNTMVVEGTLEVPENIEASLKGTKYKLEWSIEASSGTYTVSDYISVLATEETTSGIPDIITLNGQTIKVSAIFSVDTDTTLVLYKDNNPKYSSNTIVKTRTLATGFEYELEIIPIDANIHPSMEPLNLVWTVGNDAYTGSIWYVTPSILSAATDVSKYADSLSSKLNLDDMNFSMADLLTCLRAGMDRFNGTGLVTDITMTNAKGPIRSFWLLCAQAQFLRTRYMEEAMAAFNFSGQATSLESDLTAPLESLASTIDSLIEQQLPDFKRQLHARGQKVGDGSNVTLSNFVGAIGLSTGPLSSIGLGWRQLPRY